MSNASLKTRQEMERLIRERVVDELLAAGFMLNVNNGGDDNELPAMTTDRLAVLAVMDKTDDEHLLVEDSHTSGWVYFVYGNDGWDVVSDYTTNLERYLTASDALAEALDNGHFVITPVSL